MRFSIVTPSYRNSDWLRLCAASVADQEGVEFEHIVQDSCSDDGTQDWLPHDSRVKAFIEKDTGMYDAVNRGFRRASGDVLAYLNCDEQYLPGALRAVHDYFERHPDIDVVLPDTVIVNPDGSYVCHRYSLVPTRNAMWVRFNVLSCSLFIRRRVLDDYKLYFDTKWRALGDFFWVNEAVRRGVRFGTLRCFASVFTETGANMALTANALRESRAKRDMTAPWIRKFGSAILLHHRLRMLMSGVHFQKPFSYSLFTIGNTEHRVSHHVERPTALWKNRFNLVIP